MPGASSGCRSLFSSCFASVSAVLSSTRIRAPNGFNCFVPVAIVILFIFVTSFAVCYMDLFLACADRAHHCLISGGHARHSISAFIPVRRRRGRTHQNPFLCVPFTCWSLVKSGLDYIAITISSFRRCTSCSRSCCWCPVHHVPAQVRPSVSEHYWNAKAWIQP